MKRKYNIALLPQNKSEEIIKSANYFSDITATYLLGEHALPHVTLYQFFTEENQIHAIWQSVINSIKTTHIYLTLSGFSIITFDNELFWISLMPDQRDYLAEMHKAVAKAINHPDKILFDPHVTLGNTVSNEYIAKSSHYLAQYSPIADKFVLSLGDCDEVGQFTTLLASI